MKDDFVNFQLASYLKLNTILVQTAVAELTILKIPMNTDSICQLKKSEKLKRGMFVI